MLIAQVTRTGWDGPRRYTFAYPSVGLFKDSGTEIVLVDAEGPALGPTSVAVGSVSDQAGRLLLERRGGGTIYVNGQRIGEPCVLTPDDEVRVGLFRYRFWFAARPAKLDRTPYVASDPTEQQLIDALAHPATRGVYADWLEQRGEVTRAALLRTQDALVDAPAEQVHGLRGRLAALAAEVPVGWRAVVANPAIEQCGVRFRFECPKQWDDLVRTDRDDVRHCRTCERDVYYAISVGEARKRAAQGHCVALDITSARWRGDLEPPYNARCQACGSERSPTSPLVGCDHCGRVEARAMRTLGMIG